MLCSIAPLVLCCDWVNHGLEPVKHDLVKQPAQPLIIVRPLWCDIIESLPFLCLFLVILMYESVKSSLKNAIKIVVQSSLTVLHFL